MAEDLPVLSFQDLAAWESWLEANGSASPGIWMKLSKAGAPAATVSKKEAIEAALCFGWIDGQLGKGDDHYFVTRFTPRGPRSKWSLVNRETAERLIQEERMRPAGMREIERARADGRWDAAYAPASRAEVPEDLLEALAVNSAAKRMFDQLDGANRYAILYRVQEAKRTETRAARIARFVEMLARGETIHRAKRKR